MVMEIERRFVLKVSWDELCTIVYALSEVAVHPNSLPQIPTESTAFNLLHAISSGSDSFDGQVERTREAMVERYRASKGV